jgi:hypothetical protein
VAVVTGKYLVTVVEAVGNTVFAENQPPVVTLELPEPVAEKAK